MKEKFGPKALSNRLKSKGLQKLKNYCEMCQKQCRDDNGFKCHCMSEGHLRQMQIYGENPNKFVEKYSNEFETGFLDHLRRCHGCSCVAATVVYNEFIADRNHVHMNATKWLTVTEFVMYLGREGKCKVEDTEKGWFVTCSVRNSEGFFHDRNKTKRLKMKLMEEEKQAKEITKQIERIAGVCVATEQVDGVFGLHEDGENRKVAFALGSSSSLASGVGVKRKEDSSRPTGFEDVANEEIGLSKKKKAKSNGGRKSDRLSVLDDLMREEEEAKERKNRKDYWLCEGIIVKVLEDQEGCYNKKGVVRKVVDKCVAEIEMLDASSTHLLRIR